MKGVFLMNLKKFLKAALCGAMVVAMAGTAGWGGGGGRQEKNGVSGLGFSDEYKRPGILYQTVSIQAQSLFPTRFIRIFRFGFSLKSGCVGRI